MRGGTELGRVRGLGSAKEGAGHWWLQRVTAFVNIILMLWFVVSLARLPSLDYGIVTAWMRQPLVAVPLALIVINTFWHFRLGLQVVIEDYQHDETRIVFIGLLNIFTFGTGGLALFSILKVALTGTPQ
ncbi:MAG: succinate dehydrogenase, hydrophobic membrane anchor protein [Sphingomonadales bacterium]